MIDLTNGNNLQYVGPVYFGTPLQGSASDYYVYDTGSGFLTVTATGCTNCSSVAYNPAQSASYQDSIYTQSSLSYGSADLTGSMGQDDVCLISGDPSTCVNGFNFFMIKSETGLQGLDGILGLSPSSSGNGPSYMSALYS